MTGIHRTMKSVFIDQKIQRGGQVNHVEILLVISRNVSQRIQNLFTAFCCPDGLNNSAIEVWNRNSVHIEDEGTEAELKPQPTARSDSGPLCLP